MINKIKKLKVLAINPGSDSVKIALYEENNLMFRENIKNSISELKNNLDLNLIIPSKIKKILDKLNEHSVLL